MEAGFCARRHGRQTETCRPPQKARDRYSHRRPVRAVSDRLGEPLCIASDCPVATSRRPFSEDLSRAFSFRTTMSRRSAHLSCNFPSFLGICSLLLIIAVPVTSALVYCQLEPSDAGHGDGYPLPIPLPQESSTRSPAPVTEKPRRTRPRYYECPARTRCCPKNQCCPEPGQEAEEAKPERKFYEIDQR